MILCSVEMNFAYSHSGSLITAEEQQVDLSEVTFVKSETKRDIELEKAFSKAYDLKRGVDKIHYYYNRVDLNNDKVPETFVYLSGPTVCGTGGCSALIFQTVDHHYEPVSRFTLARTPIIIEDAMTKGWKNIIMYVAGGGIEAGYKRLRFDGKEYPLNPSIQPEVKNEKIRGIGIISVDLSKTKGIEF